MASKKIGVDRLNKYVGYECPVCKKEFQPEDDVVVCPVCGAPHHRACYQQNGGCALESRHSLGQEWQPPRSDNRASANAGAVCPVCGFSLASGAQFCPNCGSLLGSVPGQDRADGGSGWEGPPPPRQETRQNSSWAGSQGSPWGGAENNGPQNSWGGPGPGWQGGGPRQGPWNGATPPPYGRFASPFAGMDMNEEIDGITAKEYAAMVGPSSPYYLARFRAMADRRSVSWNWGAFFFNFLYFFYRKMYAVGALLLALFVASLLPSFLFTWEYLQELVASGAAIAFPLPQIYTPHMDQLMLMQSFLRTLWFVVMLLCGLWANRLYFSAAKNTILRIRQDSRCQDVSFYIRSLTLRGGVSKGSVAAVVGILFLAYMCFSYVVGLTILG